MTDTELARRVEKLERDNWRLKRGGLALLVLLVAMTTIYATRPVPDVIKAHAFAVVNDSGNPRMVLKARQHGPATIGLFDQEGRLNVLLAAGTEYGPQISLANGTTGHWAISLNAKPHSNAPIIRLSDAQGFTMELGNTATVTPQTGQTQNTSADSIIMFGNGKSHHVIWQAP